MQITIGRFIKRKNDFDSENIICPIHNYDRDKYLNRRILVRILFILIFGFGFGYTLAMYSITWNDFETKIINFIIFYILNFYLIQSLHEFTHLIFYPKPFKNKNNYLVFFNKKRIVTSELNEEIKPFRLCISLITPFIIFSIVPLIVIYYIGFDLYLYTLSFANAILSSDDLLNIILQFFVNENKNGYKRLYIIPNNYDYLLEDNDKIKCLDNNMVDKATYDDINAEEVYATSDITYMTDEIDKYNDLNSEEIELKINEDSKHNIKKNNSLLEESTLLENTLLEIGLLERNNLIEDDKDVVLKNNEIRN